MKLDNPTIVWNQDIKEYVELYKDTSVSETNEEVWVLVNSILTNTLV